MTRFSKRTLIVALALFLTALACGAWWYRASRPQEVNPEEMIALVQEFQEIESSDIEDAEKEEKAEETKGRLANMMDSFLSSHLKGLFEQATQQQAEEAEKFFALPPEEQTAHLDRMIAEQEKSAKEIAAMIPKEVPPGESTQVRVTESKENKTGKVFDFSSSKSYGLDKVDLLSAIPPKQRAQVAEYDRRIEERRKELGLPPSMVKNYSFSLPFGKGEGRIRSDASKGQ